VTIEPDIGNVALTGTRSVRPSETTTYTLTAENDAGSVDATAELVVEPEEEQAVISCSGVYGGNGGTGFEDYVPPDSRICEIRVRSGDWINQVQVVYKTQNGPIIEAPPHGGNGGTLQVFSLQDGEYIEQITGKYGLYIDSMEIVTNMQTRRFGGSGGDNYYSLGCEGCEIVGLLGRSANYLDALGARYKSPPDI
ncbi:MAG TPA: jacalin-like lectin, partial [Methanothrix sp.]|nr:jacalin-like lectin [Methanothrix sp.]